MSARSRKSDPQIWMDFDSATSSPGFPDGRAHSHSPDGQKINPPGREVAPARRSAAPVKRKAVLNAVREAYFRILSKPEYSPAVSAGTNGPPIIDTFGRNFIGSSKSADLQSFLVNRLQARMGKYGSLEYELVWKSKDMALGPAICALRASQRRTSGSDYTGWPSPVANKSTPQQRSDFTPTLAAVAERNRTDQLPRQASQAIQGWSTPTAEDPRRGIAPPRATDTGVPLSQQAGMVSGTTGESSTLLTEKRGGLNPELSRWLQGYPETWTCSGRLAMQLIRTLRANSSKPRSKSSTKPPKKNLPHIPF